MTGLDTNVLLRYLLKDDAAQAARAEREIERDERFVVDGIVLCEVVWVLETGYGFSRTEVADALDKIVATAQFEIDAKDLVLAALADFRRSAADFSDSLIGRRNRSAGATDTATFDRSLKALDGFRLL